MNINLAMMITNHPTLDLHGYDRQSAYLKINDFINDSIKQEIEYIVIIHGIGTGIIKQTTNQALRNNKNVIEFKSFYNNNGSVIVRLKKFDK